MNRFVKVARDVSLLLLIVVGMSALLIVALGAFAIQGEAVTAPQTSVPQTRALASFNENEVDVALAFEEDAAGQGWLVGTFTPTREGFHLYSLDLPKGGIQGLGRPTLIEQVTSEGVKPLGALVANQAVIGQYTHAIGQTLPVYPDGPVTLRVQVNGSLPRQVAITYMACNQYICLAPVTEKRVELGLP